MKPLQVFIGYDHAENVAYNVLCNSIWRHASVPVSITPVSLKQVRNIMKRNRDPLQSNDFAFSRFLTPYLSNYEGFSVFMDCDMLVMDDIAKLFQMANSDYAVQVVKHDHQPQNKIKYLGTTQTQYPKKNWSSVMLFNNELCTALTPEYVSKASGLELHQFKWLSGDWAIGDLPLEWNFLVDYYQKRRAETLSNVHFTEGGPYFEEYIDCDYSDQWFAELKDMVHCDQRSDKSKVS